MGRSTLLHISFLACSVLLVACAELRAANATVPGVPTSPYPTLINLAVEWPISGDDNLNGVVTVRYRMQGDATFKQGMPLRRIPAGHAPEDTKWTWINKHSGSIFDLRPATTYEIELTLTDPDGGSTVQTITATTRPVPAPAANATIVNVDTTNYQSKLNAAQPGHIFVFADGTYGLDFGTITKNGTLAQPIVIRAANAGKVVTGDVRLDGLKYIFLEGLTVNGRIKFNGAEGLSIRRCTVNAIGGNNGTGDGIITETPVTNCYIADNVVTGTSNWNNASMGSEGANLGEGIQVTGPGNVVCYNKVSHFRDNLSTLEEYGNNQVCIDFYNNDVISADDDGVEADFSDGNVRVMRNRLTNCFMGLSSQPGMGGPTYFIRNVMYNLIYSPLKPMRGSVGDVFIHNTVVKSGDGMYVPADVVWGHALFRNNLIIGGPQGGTYGSYDNGTGKALYMLSVDNACDFNYDGYGVIGAAFSGRINSTTFDSIASLRANSTEKNAVQVDMSVFNANVPFPYPPIPELPIPDMRLKSGSAAENTGIFIPNIDDGYSGSAPDLGAYEIGAPLPLYGPRPPGVDENTIFTTPQAPTNLIAVAASSTRVDLSWTDTSSDELNFEIQRSTDGGATFTPLATVAANATTYADVALASATSYSYRVRASNGAGPSAFSNVASAITLSGGGGGPGGGDGGGGGGSTPPPTDTDGDGVPDSMDTDDDNDGVPDAVEIAAGTDPLDPNSKPGQSKIPFTLTKLSGSAKFKLIDKDACLVSGILPSFPALFDPTGKTIVFQVGGATETFTLDAKARGKSATGSVALKLKPSKRNKATKKVEFQGGAISFAAKLKSGTWSDDWADEGMDPTVDKKKVEMDFVVDVLFNGADYTATAAAVYSGKAEKTGKFSFKQKAPR